MSNSRIVSAWIIRAYFKNGKKANFGPFATETRAMEYRRSAERDFGSDDVGSMEIETLCIPHNQRVFVETQG